MAKPPPASSPNSGKPPAAAHAYHAQYQFTTPTGETLIRKKREVNSLAYLQAREGDVITVLFDPEKPKRSLPYELSDFEIVGAARP